MTEDMGSTATSNFTYKQATRNSAPPTILRRISFQSNATACTDELSNDDEEEEDDDDEEAEIDVVGDEDDDVARIKADDEIALTPKRRLSRHRRPITTQRMEAGVDQVTPLNASVNIKRKHYELPAAEMNCCSSCSSCSCCELTEHSSSSLELDVCENVTTAASAQLTVMADCHYCSMHSNTSDEDAHAADSFCSCQSDSSCCSCCCLEKELAHKQEEHSASTATPQMCTAREYSMSSALDVGEEEQLSRTLTPLSSADTAASTPIAEDSEQQTLRSNLSRAEDGSESAEFYSLSSCAPAQLTPVHKSCRHHQHQHQHKQHEASSRSTQTKNIDSYL